MYKVTIEGIAELTEEVIKVEFRSEIITNSTVALKVVATIVVTGQISFDSDRTYMKESTRSIASWSLLRPGHGDVYKNVKVVLTNTGETRYELPYAFPISYHEWFEDQNGFFELVVKEVNPECLPNEPIAVEIPLEKEILEPNEENHYSTGKKDVGIFIKNSVNENFQQNVSDAFDADVKVSTLANDTTVYRYHGGTSKGLSYWVTPNKTSNPAVDLALPPGNSYQCVDTYVIPKGTTVLEGHVAPNFGQSGGGYQFFVPDPSVLIKI